MAQEWKSFLELCKDSDPVLEGGVGMVPRVFFLPLPTLLLLVLGFEAQASDTPSLCSATES